MTSEWQALEGRYFPSTGRRMPVSLVRDGAPPTGTIRAAYTSTCSLVWRSTASATATQRSWTSW